MLLSLSEGRWRREERQRDNQPDERLKRGRTRGDGTIRGRGAGR
jgi:hypothetical protein